VNPLIYVVSTALVVSLAGNSWMKLFTIPNRDSTIVELREIISAQEHAIMYQNKEVEQYRVDVVKANKLLAEWKELPAEVKWKTSVIYKDVIIKEEMTCEDNKHIEDNVFSSDWNSI